MRIQGEPIGFLLSDERNAPQDKLLPRAVIGYPCSSYTRSQIESGGTPQFRSARRKLQRRGRCHVPESRKCILSVLACRCRVQFPAQPRERLSVLEIFQVSSATIDSSGISGLAGLLLEIC
jgi:hypothetical protein